MIVCVQLLLSGCWSKRELTDLALVLALGIDMTKDGKYEVSMQIVNPGNVAGAVQQGGGGGQGLPIVVYHQKGDNIVEAARKASTMISRRLYFSHTNMLVIGEKVAKKIYLLYWKPSKETNNSEAQLRWWLQKEQRRRPF